MSSSREKEEANERHKIASDIQKATDNVLLYEEKRRELENIVFGFDDAGMSQRPEDKEVSETIKFKEKYNFADGGLMDLGGKEMDLRKGGFVPIGKKERADDVPARLSKNEFVMTADAVRGAGGGNINKGAKRMYETMNRLEARA